MKPVYCIIAKPILCAIQTKSLVLVTVSSPKYL